MGAAAELWVPDLVGILRDLVHQVPPGRVTTYRALAEALGDPEAVRFVAAFLAGEEVKEWPVHRVVHSSGAVGRVFGEDTSWAAAKLRAEGVRVVGDRVEPLLRYFFDAFRTDRPLARLQAEQRRIGEQVRLAPLPEPRRIGAVDVAYRGELAYAAYVLAGPDGDPLDYLVAQAPAKFPYIRTYLSYRELPAYLAVLREAQGKGMGPDVLLVDGNGILHPRRAGVASHLGVLLDLPSVGVAKGHLCGDVNTEGMTIGEWRPVLLGEEVAGAALRTGRNRTLFISPGHRADLPTSVDLVASLTRNEEIPTPLRFAHEIATEAARA
ncbi:MAG: endonuclease V [Candidatus Bipolaricaulota bacterium]|nr:endonuclease V [Candidatus Bipolaricaulota bacterium]MDW8152141.1 endonuclease V [Candidatus Bipolaricaulota bacterium]